LYGCCVDDDVIISGGGGMVTVAGQMSYSGLVTDSEEGYFSSANCPDQPWSPVGFLFHWYRGHFPGGEVAGP